MHKRSLAESLLALFAGHERAAAILGDLTEMAATRGRLWFAAAYLRTLVALTWRIVLALFVADVGRQAIFDLFHMYLVITPAAWRANTGSFVNVLNSSGPLLACIMSTLWFALFFALVRYGRRDPFVRLTALVTLGTFLAFLAIPWVSLIAAAATVVLALAAFLSNSWRKPFEVLAWTGAVGVVAVGVSTVLAREFLFNHQALSRSLGSHPAAGNLFALAFQSALLLVAVVCSRLHRLVLPGPAQTA